MHRLMGFVASSLWLLPLVASHASFAGTLESRHQFDVGSVRLTSEGVDLEGFMKVGGADRAELPMELVSFYVPVGYEVVDVKATRHSESLIAESHRTRLRARVERDVHRPFPRGALDADGRLNEAAVLLEPGTMAGHRIQTVAVFPVRIDARNRVWASDEITLSLDLAPSRSAFPGLRRERFSAAAEAATLEALGAIVTNSGDLPEVPLAFDNSTAFLPTALPSIDGSAVDMVIVTTAALEPGFQPLADWKTQKGVPTVIRTTEWIDANYPQGHDQPERIRLFIQDAYAKWGSFLVLLGGDYDEVTPRSASNSFFFNGALIPTDQYFACLDGDWNADGDELFGEGWILQGSLVPIDNADVLGDVFVGRAPVSTLTEVATFVAKSMTYGKTPPVGYVEDSCILSEVLFPADWESGQPLEDIILDGKDLTVGLDSIIPASWARTTRYQSENNEDRNLALFELSSGHHLTTITNHGDAFKFSVGNGLNPLIFVADTDTLTNGDDLHVLLATACNPNQFDLESWGESMLNNPNGGAIVSIGPTRVDFPISANEYHKEMLRVAFDHDITRFGAMTQVNRARFAGSAIQEFTPDRWTTLSKCLLGDPELRMWTSEPGTLSVGHAPSVTLGASEIAVAVTDGGSPVGDALVCISDDQGTYSRVRTNAAGIATVPLRSGAPSTANIVVTKLNYRPAESSFSIDPVVAPLLALTGQSIDDDSIGGSSGNGDGNVDAGETIELTTTVSNGGGGPADAVSMTATIAPGSEATFDLLFDGVRDAAKVFVGPDRTNPGSVPFTLDFASPSIEYIGTPGINLAANDSTEAGIFLWQDRFGWHLWWNEGTDSLAVTGTVTTNGSIRNVSTIELETNDSAVVSATADTLTISGLTHSTDLVDQIDFALADSTSLSIVSGSVPLGTINAGASVPATISVAVSPSTRTEKVGFVDLEFTSTSGGPWMAEIPLVVVGPTLDAYFFALEDGAVPPVSGNGNGVIEVGETVRITPTVSNLGAGQADAVSGSLSAGAGITLVDAADAYGDIAPLGESSGSDGFVFTVDSAAGTSVTLTLTDSVGRSWVKPIDFVAPPSPFGLTFQSDESQIVVTWAAADTSLDVAGYNVYRSLTSGSGFARQNHELLRAGARFVDDGLTFGQSFYYEVTAVDTSGNESSASPELFAYTTLAQLGGWPTNAGNNVVPGVLITDADTNGDVEVYVGSKDFNFYGWNADATPRLSFPVATNAEIWSTAAAADIDEDGDEELFWGANDSRFYAIHHDGTPVFGTEQYLVDLVGIGALFRSAVTIADVDLDWELDILAGTDLGRLYAWRADGTGLPDSTGLLFTASPEGAGSRIWGAIGVGDLEGDGIRDIVFASWNDSLYAIHSDGNVLPGFPRGATGGGLGAADNDFRSGVCMGDLDNDGTLEILAGNNNGSLYVFNHDGSGYLSPDGIFATPDTSASPGDIRSIPALCNLDADPELEIVVGTFDGNLYAYNHDGTGFLNPSGLFYDFQDPAGISASPIVVDVDGDGSFEILVGHRNGNFYAFRDDASLLVGLPIPTGDLVFSTAAADDIDGDGDVDVAFGSFDQTVNIIDFPGASTPGAYEWPTYAGNNFRTSVYGQSAPYVTGVDPVLGLHTFGMRQNAPNPFGNATSITFTMPQTGRASLQIYDVSGRLVRTLINGQVTAGQQVESWDGRDNLGRAVSSGVYFYRLSSDSRVLTKKATLLRR